jgi:hypothetical protein
LVEGRYDAAAWSAIAADSEALISWVKLVQDARR